MMADNRMFLCYRPLGKAVFLGKRSMGGYWLPHEDGPGKALTKLYGIAERHTDDWGHKGLDDDFVLLFESDTNWKYAKPFPTEHSKPIQNVVFFEDAQPTGKPQTTGFCKGCHRRTSNCKCKGEPL